MVFAQPRERVFKTFWRGYPVILARVKRFKYYSFINNLRSLQVRADRKSPHNPLSPTSSLIKPPILTQIELAY